jgi:hypothetical protein
MTEKPSWAYTVMPVAYIALFIVAMYAYVENVDWLYYTYIPVGATEMYLYAKYDKEWL